MVALRDMKMDGSVMKQASLGQPLPRRARAGAIAVSLTLGCVLLALAGPRLYGQLLMLPANKVQAAIDNDDAVSARELDALVQSRTRGLAWTDSGHTRLQLAAAEILLAQREVGGGTRYHALMAQALTALRDGLARAPADAYGWTRLAYARLALGEPADRVVPVLAMAIETAPVEATLIYPRLELCLIEWPYFAQAKPELFQQQIQLAWAQSRLRLVRLARSTSRLDAVRNALPETDRAQFDRILADKDD
jgi:hypothetical protein